MAHSTPRPMQSPSVPLGAALRPHGRFVLVIGLTNVISLMNYKIDLFLVEHFLGVSATGVYSIAVAVAELLWLLSSAVTTAAYARIGQPDREAAVALTLKAMRLSVGVLLAVSPVLWGVAYLLVPWLLGDVYAQSLPLLALLLPGVALYGAASALSAWFTNHAGRPQVPALLALCSLTINIVVSVWAIPRYGMAGGALATTVSYAVTMGVAAAWFVRAAGLPWRALWQGADLRPRAG
jgi:O-antigen/teichoic acid export membrane protein